MRKSTSEILSICEWVLAGIMTAMIVSLHLIRIRYAGPLWRDEIAALNLARMNWSDILTYFPHEAFPLLFPALLRGYTSLAGTGDIALRVFGFSIGMICLAAIWLHASLIRLRAPLVALVLFGFNPIFFCWGDSIRGYGLGVALIILTFTLFARTIVKPSAAVFCAALLSAILSVQCLLANAVLLLAIGLSAAGAQVYGKQIRNAVVTLGLGCVAALSIVPYWEPYQRAREWDIVLRSALSFRWLWIRFFTALGKPNPVIIWVWLALLVASALSADWVLRQRSPDKLNDKGLAIFAISTCALALLTYCVFLKILGYPTQDWYYLALIGLLIVAFDLIIGIVAEKLEWLRKTRLMLCIGMVTVFAVPAFTTARTRMTNMDLVAQTLKEKAGQDDFVLILPWYLGISFRQYYQSATPWETVPPISDLRIHRFDLFKEQMSLADPIAPLLKKATETLKSGHQVWIVSPTIFSPTERPPPYLAPAPLDPVGWNESSYRDAWWMQLQYLVYTRASRYTIQSIPPTLTNTFEDMRLTLVEGLR